MRHNSRLTWYATVGTLLFFYLPMLVVVLNSFNPSRYGGSWEGGLTCRWYLALCHDHNLASALFNTAVIGVGATLVSVALGTLAAFALHLFQDKLQAAHGAMVYALLGMPDILIGISLLLLFLSVGLRLGLFTVFLAHVTFCVSYVAITVGARLQSFEFSTIEAARDLGAGWPRVVRRVILPQIAPAMVAGGLLAFTISIDDFVITFFVTGPASTTLPVYLYSLMKHGSPVLINALSTIFLVVTFVIVTLVNKLTERKA